MDASTLHTKYTHLVELVFKYRTYESNYLKTRASSDKDKMNRCRRELDAFVINEKQLLESMQIEIFK